MSKTIVALDFSSREEALEFLKEFDSPVTVKVGMELTYAAGLDIVDEIKAMGHDVFLDLKLHDIPNTVKGGMKNLARRGADIVNVHAAGHCRTGRRDPGREKTPAVHCGYAADQYIKGSHE